MKITIPTLARPKKNSQQIIYSHGRPMVIQSKNYLQFEKACKPYLTKYAEEIDYPVNLKCTFYVPDRRRRDLVNFLNAIQDILTKYKVLKDDNYNIVMSVDGSRIIYEKGREEIIIEIERIETNGQNV